MEDGLANISIPIAYTALTTGKWGALYYILQILVVPSTWLNGNELSMFLN